MDNDNVVQNEVQVEAAPQVSTPVETQAESQQLGLRVDERTGRKYIEPIETEPKVEQIEDEPPKEPTVESTEVNPIQTEPISIIKEKPPVYTPAEMSLAMQLGNVDESRIPADILPQYLETKKKSEPPQPTEEELKAQFLDKVNKAAKEKTLKELGITENDLSVGEYSDDEEVRTKVERYKAALEINRKQIVDSYSEQLRIEKETARRHNEFQESIKSWIEEQRSKEPHFDDIGNVMMTRYKEMPYEKAAVIAPAIQKAMNGQLDEASAEIVAKYYEDTRKEYYAKLNGTSTTPSLRSPSVETKGDGKDTVENVNYKEMLREAPARDKAAIVAAWINAKR